MGSSNVEFTISGLNAKLGGNASGRFIDRVKVWYDTGSGAQLYGTFNGDQQSTVNVSVTGIVQSVWVTLEDGYDGNSQVTQSISFTSVTYCTSPPAPVQGGEENGFSRIESRSMGSVLTSHALKVYPNPARSEMTIQWEAGDTPSIVNVFDYTGRMIWTTSMDEGDDRIFLELDDATFTNGIYLIKVSSGNDVLTRSFVVAK